MCFTEMSTSKDEWLLDTVVHLQLAADLLEEMGKENVEPTLGIEKHRKQLTTDACICSA